jgi:hypothetical protein
MRAVRLHAPGGPDRLVYDEVEPPRPGAGEVLVRVHAAAITRDELEWQVDRLPATPSYELPWAPGAHPAEPGIAPSASLIRVQTFMLTTTPTMSRIWAGLKCSASASWKRWNSESRSVSAARVRASA